ncbi:MAG TPA: diacylglycerol kinase family protein [Jatrophihabitans sp.]|nr:diacylglycerol kinase family protein [Jatrophihabitans sp.]
MARPAGSPRAAKWLSRLALLCAAAVAAVVLAGGLLALGALLWALLCLAAALAGGWWYLSRRGFVRALGAALFVAAPLGLLAVFIWHHVLWVVVTLAALLALGMAAGRAALTKARPARGPVEYPTPPPRRPFIVMNPRSGGGKVARYDLDTAARALGAQVALLEGPGTVDVAALARRAVAEGADLLGVAGGDGTQALVAGIAAAHDLPFLVISAGTRNHFAMDLGLDRERPDTGLDALRDGVEMRLDLGDINGRTFVNNASFGAYAEVVQSPAYRDDKRGTTLQMLPDLLTGNRGPRLVVHIDDDYTIEAPQAVLVSNNPYELGDIAGLGRRPRLDGGTLGVIAVRVSNAVEAAALLRGARGPSVRIRTAQRVVIDSDADEIPVGIDGEAVLLRTPVCCTLRPGALRVRVPRHRPGVRAAAPRVDSAQLVQAAFGRL